MEATPGEVYTKTIRDGKRHSLPILPISTRWPWGLLPRRSRLCGPPPDEGEHHRRAVRQAAGGVAGEAPRHREVPPLPGQCEVLQQAVREGVAGEAPGVPLGAAAGVLAEPEPDRAAVEVLEEEGAEPLARDVRGDAGCGGRGAGSPGGLPPGRVGDADDGAVCDRGGRARRGVR